MVFPGKFSTGCFCCRRRKIKVGYYLATKANLAADAAPSQELNALDTAKILSYVPRTFVFANGF
ncbi:hypothetical protein AOL_s00006g476 [Orbilia oligospora ATCC 24927]|uniref:Uncharacterized protein n=1 Tax=Arthrobotrys oligospora (strain ATCC 24927 / CBS 115.81 / DSM 1491) TaxID=756982 RepID=G1X0S5_ARTOA|nr:hypothetical protein AOL_s00006g476 [Orbilia oligospora ATCC 24927]EGX53215.1 hypothetical protein AOL_s00006g476 [Orbilia oligospora ATCC 24927]